MAKHHYEQGRRFGVEYAHREDPRENFREDVPPGSREWYEYGFDRYRDQAWEDFNEGFDAGLEEGRGGQGMSGLGAAQCKKIDRIDVCLTSTDVCSEQQITSSHQVADVCRELAICNLMQEEVWVLCVNSRGMVVAYAQVTKGSTDESLLIPADLLRIVLAAGVRNFILVHNHPSGQASPSDIDRALTRRMVEAAKMVGFTMLDHVIVAEQGHFSFRDGGLM